MKRVLFAVAAAGALAIAIPAAAQTSADINAREARLDARINQGVQNRTLTVAEAAALRAQFNDIANLEVRYRDSNGLQTPELIDLDRRLAGLEGQIRVQAADNERRGGGQYGPGNGVGQSVDQRQAALDQRIDQGVRNGSLTTEEALRLRAEFRDIANLEARYRSNGTLGAAERVDLDRRFDALSNRIQVERADNQRGYDNRGPGVVLPWQSINLRQAVLDRRIDQGVRDGSLTRREALRLRAEFRQIVQMEQRYRSTRGLQGWERADLDRRFDRLSAQIRVERADREDRRDGRGVGYNAGAR